MSDLVDNIRNALQQRCLSVILTLLLLGCDSASRSRIDANAPAQKLIAVIERRLSLMPAVARWKWERGDPIEDAAREAAVIAEFVRRAEARNFDRLFAERIVTAQLNASKIIQQDCFDRWRKEPPPRDTLVLDLAADLRPRIDRLTDELLSVAADVEPGAFTIDGDFSPAVREALSPWK